MELTEIMNLFGNYGFTAVVCIILLYQLREINKSHAEEIKSITNAVNALEVAITKLSERIKASESRISEKMPEGD